MFQLIVLIVFAIAGLVFGVLNPQGVSFNLPNGTVALPLSLLLAAALGLGMVVAGLLLSGRLLALKWKLRQAQRKFERCEAEKLALKQAAILEKESQKSSKQNKNLPDKPHA